MSYKVLSIKWRPNSFDNVVGQDHVIHTLVNAIKYNRIAQAYLFTGPRGVGKTTTARILAMSLNAGKNPEVNFNPESNNAIEIAQTRSLDVIEIDGASNRGIDEIRNLREQIKFSPMHSKYKIIIIDEVHMLTNQAFNALLRTLEEPPEHGKFIFATTDIHKVPATIISRCQRFDFNNIDLDTIVKRLKFILDEENIKFELESINLIAKKASGSMRDALSILDQTISYCGEFLKYNLVSESIGVVHHELFFQFTESILNKDYDLMINVLSSLTKTGIPANEILNDLQIHIRNLIYSKINNDLLSDLNKDITKLYYQHAGFWKKKDLIRVSQEITNLSSKIIKSENPYIMLEMCSLKILEMDKSVQIEDLLNKIKPILSLDVKDKIIQPNNFSKNTNPNKSKSQENAEDKKKSRQVYQKDSVESELNFESINENWPKILEIINNKRPSIGSIIEDYLPSVYKNNTLTCKTDTRQKYNEKMMKEGIRLAQNIFSSEFNQNFKIILDNTNHSKVNKEVEKKSKSMQSADDKVFNKVVDLFDGEIIR